MFVRLTLAQHLLAPIQRVPFINLPVIKELENFASEFNIRYVNIVDVLAFLQYFLPGDGHFSKEGASELANLMAIELSLDTKDE